MGGCIFGFCNVRMCKCVWVYLWVCVCVGFVMCGCENMWVCIVGVCICAFSSVCCFVRVSVF